MLRRCLLFQEQPCRDGCILVMKAMFTLLCILSIKVIDKTFCYFIPLSERYYSMFPHICIQIISCLLISISGLFNWTMTFQHHSDVPVPYGRIVKRQDGMKNRVEDISSTKHKLVATLQSRCGAPSGRFEYIDQLVKYLQVSFA